MTKQDMTMTDYTSSTLTHLTDDAARMVDSLRVAMADIGAHPVMTGSSVHEMGCDVAAMQMSLTLTVPVGPRCDETGRATTDQGMQVEAMLEVCGIMEDVLSRLAWLHTIPVDDDAPRSLKGRRRASMTSATMATHVDHLSALMGVAGEILASCAKRA